MKVLQKFTAALILCVAALHAYGAELDVVQKRYIEMLSNGGPSTVRDTAQSMHRSGESDERVLDVAAEVLLRDYKSARGNSEIDALAWVTNALSNAKTSRYNGVLQEVQENAGHKKLAKYASKNFNKRLPEAPQYAAGTVNLEKLAKQTASAAPAAPAKAQGDKQALSVVRAGMKRQEVYDLIGHPTNTRNYITGKSFRPFNYRGNDTVREEALYKGQGRIVFSNTSHYSNDWEVLEVIIDERETGYP